MVEVSAERIALQQALKLAQQQQRLLRGRSARKAGVDHVLRGGWGRG